MEQAPDRKRVQQFAPRKLFTHYTSGMLMLMVDIGLFEAASELRTFILPAERLSHGDLEAVDAPGPQNTIYICRR